MPSRDQILRAIGRVLVPEGFSKVGGHFKRQTKTQLINAVALQAGTKSLAGKSTVNLCIYIPQAHAMIDPAEKTAPTYEACDIMVRLSRLAFGNDHWFDRDDPNVAEQISGLIVHYGLPYFAEFESLPAIATGIRNGILQAVLIPWRVRAAVFALTGAPDESRAILRQYTRSAPEKGALLASKMGIEP